MLLLTGCLLKKTTIPARHFVLSAMSTNENHSAPKEYLSVGIGFVRMPSYLLNNSIALRNNANEIDFLEDAVWAERLDQCFQRALAANLSRLLSSDSIYLSDWARDQVMVRLSINVHQFDVDTSGHGTLIAHWRITSSDRGTPLKSGQVQLERVGASPHGHPEIIAITLSDVLAEFSRDLAQAIRESIKPVPSSSK
jgi:uncharacterized lipoprotein YmbA